MDQSFRMLHDDKYKLIHFRILNAGNYFDEHMLDAAVQTTVKGYRKLIPEDEGMHSAAVHMLIGAKVLDELHYFENRARDILLDPKLKLFKREQLDFWYLTSRESAQFPAAEVERIEGVWREMESGLKWVPNPLVRANSPTKRTKELVMPTAGPSFTPRQGTMAVSNALLSTPLVKRASPSSPRPSPSRKK